MIKLRLALATAVSMAVMLLSSPTIVIFVNGQQQQEETATSSSNCDLDCPTDAPCTFGHTDFTHHPLNEQGSPIVIGDTREGHHIDGMHCDCPTG